MLFTGGGDYRHIGSGRNSHKSVDNGSYRHGGCLGSAYNVEDVDNSSGVKGKPSKRGVSSGYSSNEKCGSKSPILAHSFLLYMGASNKKFKQRSM